MSELRERFERHQAGLLNIDYEELRDQFDRHEEIFGKRYVTFSDFEKEFELWQACWSHQQAIIDQLNSVLEERTKEWLQAIELGAYFENAAKPLKEENDSLRVQLSLQRDRNKALETELTSSRNYGDDLQKRVDEYEKLTTSIRNEFNLWTDGREFADVIEAQIENLEALRGES